MWLTLRCDREFAENQRSRLCQCSSGKESYWGEENGSDSKPSKHFSIVPQRLALSSAAELRPHVVPNCFECSCAIFVSNGCGCLLDFTNRGIGLPHRGWGGCESCHASPLVGQGSERRSELIDRGPPKPLTARGQLPAVSRAGNRLAYARVYEDPNIWRVDLDGGPGGEMPRRKLASSTRAETVPRISPNGEQVVFVSNRAGGPDHACILSKTGTQPSATASRTNSPKANYIALVCGLLLINPVTTINQGSLIPNTL